MKGKEYFTRWLWRRLMDIENANVSGCIDEAWDTFQIGMRLVNTMIHTVIPTISPTNV